MDETQWKKKELKFVTKITRINSPSNLHAQDSTLEHTRKGNSFSFVPLGASSLCRLTPNLTAADWYVPASIGTDTSLFLTGFYTVQRDLQISQDLVPIVSGRVRSCWWVRIPNMVAWELVMP